MDARHRDNTRQSFRRTESLRQFQATIRTPMSRKRSRVLENASVPQFPTARTVNVPAF
jgi:hypothetical protein